ICTKNTPSVSKISLPLQKHFIYNKFFIFFTSFAIISNIILEKGEVALSKQYSTKGKHPSIYYFFRERGHFHETILCNDR
ncbi:MAG: hypothetical protein ACLT4X_08605, partial [Phascolarctobacterium sp.]